MSTKEEIIELYKKERDYENILFGDYKNLTELSFPSFIIFLRRYINKIEIAYTEDWSSEKPPWFKSSKEFDGSGSAPISAYKELIKLFALAGAALETYTEIEVEKWRQDEVFEPENKTGEM